MKLLQLGVLVRVYAAMRRCCILRRGAGALQVRWASGQSAAAAEGWIEEMEQARAAEVRSKAEIVQAGKEGECLLRAHCRSLLAGYKGRVTPSAAAYVLRKTRDPFQARSFFDWASKQPGFAHNDETCSALLAVFLKARLFKNAFDLFTQDLWSHCARSPAAYSTMVEGYCYVGNMQPALSLLRQMEKMGFHISVALHNVVLKGLCKADRLDDAVDHFAKMERNKETDLASYTLIISQLCKHSRVNKAVDLLYSMNEETCVPDVGIYNCILEQLCEMRMNVAMMLFEQMIEAGCLPDLVTFGILVRGCFANGLLEEGNRLLKQMVDTGFSPDLNTFNAVVEGLCKARRIDNARQVMEEMSSQGCTPSVTTHNFLLEALCKMDKLDEVHRHVQRMIAAGCSPDASTYKLVIKKLCKESRAMEAHRFFQEMVGRGCEPDSSIYNMLLSGHCNVSKATAAYDVFKQMLDRGVVPEPASAASLVHLLQKAHRYAEAKQVARVIPEAPLLLN